MIGRSSEDIGEPSSRIYVFSVSIRPYIIAARGGRRDRRMRTATIFAPGDIFLWRAP
jgi:hypothetical protein